MVVSVHGRATWDALLAPCSKQVDAAVRARERAASALQGARQLRVAHPARFGNFNHHHDQLMDGPFDLFSAARRDRTSSIIDPRLDDQRVFIGNSFILKWPLV